MSRIALRILTLALLAGTAQAQPANVRVVNAAAPPGGDGMTWATAYNDLQAALDQSPAGTGVTEIWVARGTYVPAKSAGPDPLLATFSMRNSLAILGGFAGKEVSHDARDPLANPTVLDGRGAGQPGVYHVVTATGADSSAVLDGFTITGGQAAASPTPGTDQGGGLYADPGSPTLGQLSVVSDYAAGYGGGAYIVGSPIISGCRFEANSSSAAGGAGSLYTRGLAVISDCVFTKHNLDREVVLGLGSPGFWRCTFSENTCLNGSTFLGVGSFTDCAFLSNGVSEGGGAVRGTVFCVRCLFDSNYSHTGFGGAVDGSGTFTDCRFLNNRALDSGGAIYGAGTVVATRCVFEANTALYGGAVHGRGRFDNCLFRANAGGAGRAVFATGPTELINCTVAGDDPQSEFTAVTGPVGATNCILWGNGATLASQFMGQSLNYSTVQHWDGSLGGVGNSGQDPLFVDLAARDLHLLAGSPCIDSGRNSALPPGAFSDLDGRARFFDSPSPNAGSGSEPFVDRGCYEAGAPPFCYANIDNSMTAPVVNVADFAQFLNLYAAGHPLANCDASTTPPTLNVLDFVCFIDRVAAGCSSL